MCFNIISIEKVRMLWSPKAQETTTPENPNIWTSTFPVYTEKKFHNDHFYDVFFISLLKDFFHVYWIVLTDTHKLIYPVGTAETFQPKRLQTNLSKTAHLPFYCNMHLVSDDIALLQKFVSSIVTHLQWLKWNEIIWHDKRMHFKPTPIWVWSNVLKCCGKQLASV